MPPTLADRILAHLSAFPIEDGAHDVPREITQDGIAAALGNVQVAHVSRALKRLIADGLVAAHLAHPAGGSRRARAHGLTARGREEARALPPMPATPVSERASAPNTGAISQVWRVAGREKELATLAAAAADARASGPRFALVEGDAGSGKTRLLDAFAADITATRGGSGGVRVLRASSAPTGAEQLVGPIGPALEPLGFDRRYRSRTAGTPRERALAAAIECIVTGARDQPLALVLDDLQYAGPTVAEFLHGLMRGLPARTRALVVAAIRREEAWELPNGPLYTALMPLRELPNALHVDLAPLDLAGVAALLSDAGVHVLGERNLPEELVARVWRESGGNASFALAIGEQLADGVDEEDFFPSSVLAAVNARFTTLAPELLQLLQLAAVAGPEFEYSTLLKASREEEDAMVQSLDLLIDRLFLEEVPSHAAPASELRLRFRHPKIREALLSNLTGTRRVFLEEQLARAHQG